MPSFLTSPAVTIAVGVTAAAVLVTGVVTVVTHKDPPTAREVATSYLKDLAAGDTKAALTEVAIPKHLNKVLLTNAVLSPAHRIRRPAITALVVKGSTATATVTYAGTDDPVTDTLTLSKKHGHWLVANGISELAIDAGIVATTGIVNGVRIPLHKGKAAVAAFPGVYNGVLPNQWEVSGSAQPATLTASTGYLSITTVLTPAAIALAKRAAVVWASNCFAHSHTDQDPCGSDETGFVGQTGSFRITNTNVRWEVLSPSQVISVDYDAGTNVARLDSYSGKEGRVRFSSTTTDTKYPDLPPLAFTDIGGYTINGKVTFVGRRAVYVAE